MKFINAEIARFESESSSERAGDARADALAICTGARRKVRRTQPREVGAQAAAFRRCFAPECRIVAMGAGHTGSHGREQIKLIVHLRERKRTTERGEIGGRFLPFVNCQDPLAGVEAAVVLDLVLVLRDEDVLLQ